MCLIKETSCHTNKCVLLLYTLVSEEIEKDELETEFLEKEDRDYLCQSLTG